MLDSHDRDGATIPDRGHHLGRGLHPENNKAIYLEDNDRREKCGVSKEHGEGRLAQPEGGDSRAEPEQRVKVIRVRAA